MPFHPVLYWVCECDYLFTLGLKLICVSKRGPYYNTKSWMNNTKRWQKISITVTLVPVVSCGIVDLKSILVQLMACCLMASSHSLDQCRLCITLQWRHNGRDGISNHRHPNCLLNRLFRRRSKKTSKLRLTGLCEGNSLVTGEFPAQRASSKENVSIWWCHHKKKLKEHIWMYYLLMPDMKHIRTCYP